MSDNTNMVRVKTQDPNTKGSKECYLLGEKKKKKKKKGKKKKEKLWGAKSQPPPTPH